jgi:hypothetical protein
MASPVQRTASSAVRWEWISELEGLGPVGARGHPVGGTEGRVETRNTAEAASEADASYRLPSTAQQSRGVPGAQLEYITMRGDADYIAEHVYEASPAQPQRPRLHNQVEVRVRY